MVSGEAYLHDEERKCFRLLERKGLELPTLLFLIVVYPLFRVRIPVGKSDFGLKATSTFSG
jgi:hypothetical protein